VADIISRFRLAEYFHRQAVALAEQLQHPAALGFAYQNLTVHEFALGNGDAVLEYGGRAAEIFHDTGDLHAWGSIVRFTAYVLEKRGEFTRVLNVAQDLVHIGQAAADAQVWCLGESRRGSVWRRMGRFEDAIASLLKAIELAEAIPDHSTRVESGGEKGLLGVAFHPRYRENGLFYVDYTTRTNRLYTHVSRFRRTDEHRADPKSETVVLKIHALKGSKHVLEIKDFGIDETTINRGEEKTIRFVANKAGTFKFVCTNHVDAEKEGPMVGYLYVMGQ